MLIPSRSGAIRRWVHANNMKNISPLSMAQRSQAIVTPIHDGEDTPVSNSSVPPVGVLTGDDPQAQDDATVARNVMMPPLSLVHGRTADNGGKR